ncbi:hypothetical protein NEAUS03_2031 [Nematocida ausubeli]|nr:hypothetical protein NEAUS03_2031 [Nematocida ausubeli]
MYKLEKLFAFWVLAIAILRYSSSVEASYISEKKMDLMERRIGDPKLFVFNTTGYLYNIGLRQYMGADNYIDTTGFVSLRMFTDPKKAISFSLNKAHAKKDGRVITRLITSDKKLPSTKKGIKKFFVQHSTSNGYYANLTPEDNTEAPEQGIAIEVVMAVRYLAMQIQLEKNKCMGGSKDTSVIAHECEKFYKENEDYKKDLWLWIPENDFKGPLSVTSG